MEEKQNERQLHNLSGQLMELFVANLLSKNQVDIQEAKSRITDKQRQYLKTTVEKLKTEVEEFLETKTVVKTKAADEVEIEKVTNPLREAFIQNKMKRK